MRTTQQYSRWAVVAAVLLALVWGHSGAQEGERFFETTGQRLDDQYGFLQFWTQHGGADVLGEPITGIVLEANVPTQYFEHSRLENNAGAVRVGQLGRERTRWRAFEPAVSRRADDQFFPATGHVLGGAFLRFWREHGGADVFGAPISEPLWEVVAGASVRVQYFERARLEDRGGRANGPITVGALGREVALAKGLITPDQEPAVSVLNVGERAGGTSAISELAPPTPTPVPPTPVPPTPLPPTPVPTDLPEPETTQQPVGREQVVAPTATRSRPKPTATPAAPSARATATRVAPIVRTTGKLIDVNLSTQRLVATENGVVVLRAGVSTGRDGFNTPTGTYAVYAKTPLQTMRGTLNGQSWVVPNVPNIMYINGDVALHGTYWHNLFGSGVRLSHGCINLSLKDAAWMYRWAPVGTKVVVHY